MAKEEVLVVKKKIASKRVGDDDAWTETENYAKKMEELAGDIQRLMEEVTPKIKELDDVIVKAYMKCPKKDCLLNASPLGRAKIKHALEAHMFKTGFYVGGVHWGDPKKVVSFKDYVKDGVKWLLKFSY